MTSANVTSQCFQAKFGKERAAANKVTNVSLVFLPRF